MRLQLKEHWVNYLRKLPESGMGYQRVDVYLKNGSISLRCTGTSNFQRRPYD